MRKAIFAGSFDPMTMGHLNIIQRASKMFDEVYVVVAFNFEKKTMFSADERVELIRESLSDIPNVKVDKYSGLIAEYAKNNDIKYVVRGIRNSQDAQYEIELSLNNKFLNDELETILLPAEKEYLITSSSQIKQFYTFGVDVKGMVPDPFWQRMTK